MAWRAFELGSALNTPRLMNIHVDPDAGQGEFLAIKDWVEHGQEFCAVAQLKPGHPDIKSVTVSGSVGGKAYRRTIPVENVEDNAEYLPRTWARLAIDDMLADNAEENKSRIIELSKSMYVMSPFTSLLVLENDEMYGQYNVDRGRKDHWALYPCPAKIEVVHEPLHGPQPPVIAETGDDPVKPSIAEVLKTLLVRAPYFDSVTVVDVNQLPTFSFTTSSTTVSVPDGGTVLLGGIKRRADTNGNGVPMLRNLPYVNRLFRNVGNGRERRSLMLMVTPRIIIQEEEEETLGIEIDGSVIRRGFGNVRDNDGDAALADFDSLIELITSTIAPDTWDEVGGPGVIEPFPTNLSLAISQTQQVHGQIVREFNRLQSGVDSADDPFGDPFDDPFMRHAAFDLVGDLPTAEEVRHFIGPGSHNINTITDSNVWTAITAGRDGYVSHKGIVPAGSLFVELFEAPKQRVLPQLDERGEFKYEQQPLKDVVADLELRHGVPIEINRMTIEESGIKLDAPITLNDSEITLRSALNQILAQLDLTYFITTNGLQITTPEDMENRLVWRNYDFDEVLLLIARGRSNATAEVGFALNDPRRANRWAQILNQRIAQGSEQPNLLYPPTGTVGHRRSHRRLVAFAPATGTTSADVSAVMDAEASLEDRPKLGEIDQRARELINAARGWGWRLIKLRDADDRVIFEVTMDGQGRLWFDHRTEHGLRETVVCDGETLRHFYPELGLGTTRQMSRFHRADLAQLVPWLLPTVEDLAVGADLRLIGPRTIAIAPHGIRVKDAEGQPHPYFRIHLEFAEDARLAERRLVEMPSGKTILSVAYSADGTVRWFDGDNEQLDEFHIAFEKTDAPDLQPDTEALVVLPMPVRSRDHVYKTAKEASSQTEKTAEKTDALAAIASDEQNRAKDPARWSEEDVLRLLATNHLHDAAELRDVIGRRFFARGDRRIGFYTLLVSSGQRWDVDQRVQLDDGTTTQMDPLADHPNSTLARYLDCQLRQTRFDSRTAMQEAGESSDGFVLQLAQYRQLAARWSLPSGPPDDAETRRRELDELFGLLSQCDSPKFAYTLLRRLQRRYGDSQPHGRIAKALIEIEKQGMISYAVKYELARSLAATGEKEKARSLFTQLYREALNEGVLPPIDQAFSAAIQESDSPFESDENEEKGLSGLMRGACAELVQRKQRPLAIVLAWQCRQLGEATLGDMLVGQTLTGVPQDEQLGTTLAALEYLTEAGNHDRADALLKALLSNQPFAESPTLLRLASRVARDGGRLARSASHLDRAMDLEYESLPDSYNVEQIRQRYGQLFASYRELAQIVASPESDAPLGLVTRVIKAADRWRSLDTDVTAACNEAASVLSELGKEELAWDYLTTPLADKPNEAVAWLNLAQTLRGDGKLELAYRAYETAYEAEPTNAQILWDHAQLLEQSGRTKRARALYQQIANSEWQPRFNQIKHQAERLKAGDAN